MSFLVDYVRENDISTPLSKRQDSFRILKDLWRLWGFLTPKELARLETLLEAVYGLTLLDTDPRALTLQCLLYTHGALIFQGKHDRGIECRVDSPVRGRSYRRKVVDGESTFDVCFLGSKWFEGHECKVKLRNFLSPRDIGKDLCEWPRATRHKLTYMRAVKSTLESHDYAAMVALTCLDKGPAVGYIREALEKHGLDTISVIDGSDLVELMSMVA